MALVLHLLALAATPEPVASPISAPATGSGGLNLLPLLLAVLVVILLILIIAQRMGGRQKDSEAEVVEQRIAAPAPHTPDDGENPAPRLIYRARPAHFATPPAPPEPTPPAPAGYLAPDEPQPLPPMPDAAFLPPPPVPASPPDPAMYVPPEATPAYPPTTLAPWATSPPAADGTPVEAPEFPTSTPIQRPLPGAASFTRDPTAPALDPLPESTVEPFAFPSTAVVEPDQGAGAAPPPSVAELAPIPVVVPAAVPIERQVAPVIPPPIVPPPIIPTPVVSAPAPPAPAAATPAAIPFRAEPTAEPTVMKPDEPFAAPQNPAPELAVVVAPAVGSPAPAPGGDEKALILLIEDDERIAKFYSILFEAKGYAVRNARDGVEGVDMATTLKPSLILLDVMMPKMNGLMVLQALRANPETERTPVVVLSNYMEPPLIQRALQLGAIEYVVKSQARPEQLVNAVPLWLIGEPALH